MRFRITLEIDEGDGMLPINYQYPLSAAIYRIINKGDAEYAKFLHDRGYGKGYKFFCFSDIRTPFIIKGDRFVLKGDGIEVKVCFHLPEAMKNFVQGLFASEKIEIGDKISRQSFIVKGIEGLDSGLGRFKSNEFVNIAIKPISPLVVGMKNEKWNYDYLRPDDERFVDMFIYNWREKIKAFYGADIADNAILIVNKENCSKPCKSRLITIKSGSPNETKVKGFVNFKLNIQAECRFAELLLNTGAGLYNAQGLGCMEIINDINR